VGGGGGGAALTIFVAAKKEEEKKQRTVWACASVESERVTELGPRLASCHIRPDGWLAGWLAGGRATDAAESHLQGSGV